MPTRPNDSQFGFHGPGGKGFAGEGGCKNRFLIIIIMIIIIYIVYIIIYIYIYIDLLPVAELILQNNGSAGAMGIDGMLCQYGGLSNTFDLSRWAYGCPGSGA